MATTIITPKDLLFNASYKVISYQRLRDSCDWYYLLKIVKVLNESQELILKITNNHCYIYDKVEKIISVKIVIPRLRVKLNYIVMVILHGFLCPRIKCLNN